MSDLLRRILENATEFDPYEVEYFGEEEDAYVKAELYEKLLDKVTKKKACPAHETIRLLVEKGFTWHSQNGVTIDYIQLLKEFDNEIH